MKGVSKIGATLLGMVVVGVLGWLAWFLYCGYVVMYSSAPAETLQSFNSVWVYGASQKTYFFAAHVLFVAFVVILLKLKKHDWFAWHPFLKDVLE